MSLDYLIISILAVILAATVAYLWAAYRGKNTESGLKGELSLAQLEKQQYEQQNLTLKAQLEALLLEQRTLEMSEQKLISQNESLQSRKTELEQELILSKENLEVIRKDKELAEKGNESAQSELRQVNKVMEDLQNRLTMVEQELKSEQSTHNQLNSTHAELKTSMTERERSHTKQVEQFEQQKQSLSEQFKVLANEILDAKSVALQESSKLSLTAVMNPFQETIKDFKKEVNDIHHRETAQQGELKKELQTLKELNHKITTEAHELSTALRGQKKLQGNWGELVLENVLDRSGLQLGKDYKREVSITTEEGRQRPDVVVYLPQEKHLIIDAKVSLNAYTRYVNNEDEVERKVALAEHVKAMGDRIKELADRDYYKLPGLNSPEMVFMFVPIESAFVEALKADESLFQSAIENNVLVATPTTLLTSLNIIRQLWRYEDQNKHTAALAQKAENVFKKLNSFLSNFEGVKKGLDKATEAYSKAEGQLISGRGNLVKQVGEFKNLAPAIKAELPAYFTEKANLEIDFIPVEQETVNEVTSPEELHEDQEEVIKQDESA